MFQLLPFLKGWEYKNHDLYRSDVRRGAAPIELAISELGWCLIVTELTNDCFGTMEFDVQGADLQTMTLTANPEVGIQVGALLQDPAGWLQKYQRPNPYSTAGLFYLNVVTSGFQAAPFPYVPSVKLRISLPVESTQDIAYINLRVFTIAITNKIAFIRSLRRVLDANASLKIDKALLSIGPAEFEGDNK